jgi:hypothetical protein
MKKLYTLAITSAVALSLAGCAGGKSGLTPAKASKIDQRDVCSVEKHGIDTVLANAKAYNAAAVKEGVEFRRLNVNNSALIASVEEALAKGAKEVNPMHFKSKPKKIKRSKTKLPVDYAAWRACSFGLTALQQKHEGKSTWRLAVPGDGFKY